MPVLTVSISPEQAAQIHDAVASGAYASSSEVIRAALKFWGDTHQRERRCGATAARMDGESVNVAELYAFHNTQRR